MNKPLLFSLIASVLISAGLIIAIPRLSNKPNQLVLNNPTPSPAPQEFIQNKTGIPLSLPENFQIYNYATKLSNPRDLLMVDDVLLVSLPQKGQVVALVDTQKNGWSDKTYVVTSNLNRPHGLAYKDGILYIAETDKVSKYTYDQTSYKASKINTLYSLPSGGNHWTRSLLIANNQLYVSIGSSCNVCNESDLKRASVMVSDLDGNDLKTYSSGLRNAPFLTLRPNTNEIWVTEMGRDNLGDDTPPDEINILEPGKDYGWPYCYGVNIHDKTFDSAKYKAADICSFLNKTPSHIDLQAHSAPLGLVFTPSTWPKPYSNVLLVALHGSWNRSVPTGYKVISISLDLTGKPVSQSDFISGWLDKSNKKLGRPVDLEFNSKGELFISDDLTGNIYLVKSNSVVK